MNRRRILIALALLVPLAILGLARTTASWRPVALTQFQYAKYGAVAMLATDRLVVADGEQFDLQTGARNGRRRGIGGLVGPSTWSWNLSPSGPQGGALLMLSDGGQQLIVYNLPKSLTDTQIETLEIRVRFSPVADRVELLVGDDYFRWHAQSRQLERHTKLQGAAVTSIGALARDGESVVGVNQKKLVTLSTRNGRAIGAVTMPDSTGLAPVWFSPQGRTVLYETAGGNPDTRRVINTRSGRSWVLTMPRGDAAPVFSPDESEVAVPQTKRRVWEIRDAQSGHIIRTLPLVPKPLGAVYSPDGRTLYCVAGGTLYRQRAR